MVSQNILSVYSLISNRENYAFFRFLNSVANAYPAMRETHRSRAVRARPGAQAGPLSKCSETRSLASCVGRRGLTPSYTHRAFTHMQLQHGLEVLI